MLIESSVGETTHLGRDDVDAKDVERLHELRRLGKRRPVAQNFLWNR